jgi:6-pyruvoyltetrahydropterin/6-carboxytetrahydropterin synthase
MPFLSTKTFDHNLGLSACFRQWRANHSHCSKLHGYALSFKITFEADKLDDRNWVVDFGGLKDIKNWLVNTFDHKLVVAKDDPCIEQIKALGETGVADVLVVDSVGCERFAEMLFRVAEAFLEGNEMADRVRVHSVECREHTGNSAIYAREDDLMDLIMGGDDLADNIIEGDLSEEEFDDDNEGPLDQVGGDLDDDDEGTERKNT